MASRHSFGLLSRNNPCASSSEDEEINEETATWRQYANSPDRSMGDFRCKVCTSRMLSVEMWEAHVIGRRHLKNVKKGPNEAPSKVKTLPCNEPPFILKDILQTDLPLIGLKFVCETKRADRKVAPFYTCYLCHGTFTPTSILDHIISTKHRLNYMEMNHPDLYTLISEMPLSKPQLDSVVEDHALTIERKYGRGCIEVRTEKPKGTPFLMGRFSSSSYKWVKPEADVRLKPGPSRKLPLPPALAVHGPSPPPPCHKTASASDMNGPSLPPSSQDASKLNAYVPRPSVEASCTSALYGPSPPSLVQATSTSAAATTTSHHMETDDVGYVIKNLKNATDDQLGVILDYTQKSLQTMDDKDPLKFEILRQYARVINTIGMHQHYASLPPEKQEVFIRRLNDREECYRRLRGDD